MRKRERDREGREVGDGVSTVLDGRFMNKKIKNKKYADVVSVSNQI